MADEQHTSASIRKVELHFIDGQRFWKGQTVSDARRSSRLFRALKLFYTLNEFMGVCKFCSFCRFRGEARQSRILITNGEREFTELLNMGHCFHHKH